MATIGKFTIYAIGVIFSGLFLKLAWARFFVPLGIPNLQGYAHAFGVAALVAYLTKNTEQKDEREEAEKLVMAILLPTVSLFFAWIYKLCM
jgi:hypothetical protein